MKQDDLKVLMTIDDRLLAEEIQNFLEELKIYTLLASDNPALSILTTYTGISPTENIEIMINAQDYTLAVESLKQSQYKEMFS